MNMKTFMVNITLANINREFMSLIPEHRLHINKLMAEGTITDYALSMDRERLWTVIKAESEHEVYDVLASLPLRKYMLPEVHELMFHNKMTASFPALSLN